MLQYLFIQPLRQRPIAILTMVCTTLTTKEVDNANFFSSASTTGCCHLGRLKDFLNASMSILTNDRSRQTTVTRKER